MSSDYKINFQSLHLVQDELIATIESSARALEAFVDSEQEDAESLQSCVDGVQQIVGILKVLELRSAVILAEELLTVANEIRPGLKGDSLTRKLEVVSTTFFILTRYLEYLNSVKHQVPVLLVPHINALRKIRHEPALAESHFQQVTLPDTFPVMPSGEGHITADFVKSARRARHMYQIGLAGLLREQQVENSISLMQRALKRLTSMGDEASKLSFLWWLSDLALSAFISEKMTLLETRKFLFMRIDKVLRQVEIGGLPALHAEPPKGLIKELIYIVVLSGAKMPELEALKGITKLPSIPYSEQELQKEYAALYGPSAHTISSLSHVLQTEISSVKRTLDNSAQLGVARIDDIESFIGSLANVAQILGVVGLPGASANLKEQVDSVSQWQQNEQAITQESMTEVANALLYVESLVQDLQSADFSSDQESSANQGSRDAQVASSELTAAVQIVIKEALGGLSLTKRALNSFSDSSYDTGHIKNIAKTLNGIRGAMSLMGLARVESVLKKSVDFVGEVLLSGDHPAAISELLETFADVIIAVEYYFDSSDSRGSMDDSVLSLAEQSLQALGF